MARKTLKLSPAQLRALWSVRLRAGFDGWVLRDKLVRVRAPTLRWLEERGLVEHEPVTIKLRDGRPWPSSRWRLKGLGWAILSRPMTGTLRA
jgi:hypothetical protein